MTPPQRRCGVSAALLALFVAALTMAAPVPPASAHDQVSFTAPADTEHLDAPPTEVTMQFTDDILDVGAIILVVDKKGRDQAVGSPQLDGPAAVQEVRADLADGAYQVRWRVVSADGHPIAGTFDFSVGDVSTAETAPATPSAVPTTTTPAKTDEYGASAANPADSGTQGRLPVVLIGVIGAGIGLAGSILFTLLRSRRRHDSRTANDPDSSHQKTQNDKETIE